MTAAFYLDGLPITFSPGQSILQAAQASGQYIPHLCYHPKVGVHGSCRVCMVRVEGRMQAACSSPAVAGQQVENNTAELCNLRRQIIDMLFIEGNHICPACAHSGNCQLQAVAYHCGLLASEFMHLFPQRSIDASHPALILDHNRCILCDRCGRASQQLDGKQTLLLQGRGLNTHLQPDSKSATLGDTPISIQDAAAHICPTGALLPKRQAYSIPIGSRRFDKGRTQALLQEDGE